MFFSTSFVDSVLVTRPQDPNLNAALHPEETPEVGGEYARSTHTQGGNRIQAPNPRGARQQC